MKRHKRTGELMMLLASRERAFERVVLDVAFGSTAVVRKCSIRPTATALEAVTRRLAWQANAVMRAASARNNCR